MVTVKVAEKPSFAVVGKSVFITGQDNEQFGRYWDECHANGLVERLKGLSSGAGVTGSRIFGVSRVEKDPSNRAFDFMVATECESAEGLEGYTVPACKWAIFRNDGELPMSLIEAEMYCWTKWLPETGAVHALAPELEVYPDDGSVEYWLPIAEEN